MTQDKIDVRQHGVVVDQMKSEVKCNYCGNLIKEVEQLHHPNLPLKWNWCPRESDGERNGNKKQNGVNSKAAVSCVVDSSSRGIEIYRKIFYEARNDFNVIRSPIFQRVIKATLSRSEESIKFPSCQELKGWILQDAVKEMQQYVTEMKNSWANTDISSFNGNVDAMLLLFEEVVEIAGVENVVQIVAYSTSPCMMEAGKKLMENNASCFGRKRCFSMHGTYVTEIHKDRTDTRNLEKAKTLTQFINSHATVLKLLRDACPDELVKPSKIKSIVPFFDSGEHCITERTLSYDVSVF
ncbi:uncharacterized protein LOC132039306 [Lycium ferocissimum]|uniref:uncharacterized protein LOC132039306 n=1 Tax=Lycium ferocissimum TaxID=112874 RepID=UPI0028166EA2|nr:uncharacterized protein LOC132039306 [Lycium ferocissimum]